MWLSIGYTIPQRGDKNLKPGPPPPPQGDFVELEPNLFLVELEASTDLVELE